MAKIDIDFRSPAVMAIINVTPDSFYAASRMQGADSIEHSVEQALCEGASILDIGGYSSRPGADDIPLEQEWQRVREGVNAARRVSEECIISIDTFRPEIIRRTYEEVGEVIVNDISGGCEQMYEVVAARSLPYILMHMRGTPQSMQSQTEYRDIIEQVKSYFMQRITRLEECAVKSIILDVGFGFAKSLEQNYTLLKNLDHIVQMGYPILSGVSRKSMIYKPLGVTPEQSLIGTSALNWESLRQGATLLRVHDVREAVQLIQLYKLYSQS